MELFFILQRASSSEILLFPVRDLRFWDNFLMLALWMARQTFIIFIESSSMIGSSFPKIYKILTIILIISPAR